MEKKVKKRPFYEDEYGLNPSVVLPFAGLGLIVLIAFAIAVKSWVVWRDCPTLCAADEAEPVWTFSEGCGCAKDGELSKPLADPIELNLK